MRVSKLALCVLFVATVILTACQRETIEVTQLVPQRETVVETIIVEVTSTPPPAGSAEFKAPDPETYTLASGGDLVTLDPNLAYDDASFTLIFNVMEGLIFYSRESMTEYIPLLATEVPSLENGGISEDGLTYTFKVRQGVKFHEGGDLTPSDFEYTFERGLLQSDPNGPQWLLLEPLLGYASGDVTEEIAAGAYAGDPEELRANTAPEELLATCEKVKAVVEADDEAFTLTFHLAQPWGPFLATLVMSWGAAIDKEWAVENGAWDGSCETWQEHYAPGMENNALTDIINGTGPYRLHHWTPGEEWVLVANEDYWRADGDEMWPGGPSGSPRIERVVKKMVNDWGTRFSMLQVDDADWVAVAPANFPQVDLFVGEVCDYGSGACTPTDKPDAPLRKWPGLPSVSRANIFMNFDVLTDSDGNNPYIGSGKLDGKGIPPDFFSDIHVRRAFNHCFDYETFIADAQNGEGIRNNGPIIVGMLGYNPDGSMYAYDLEKCKEELAQAWDGVLPETGFRLQMIIPTANTTAQTAAAILQYSLRSVNEKYKLEVLGLTWPAMLQAFRAGQTPLVYAGWIEDIHDPHNWAQPFTVGAYTRRMHVPDELKNQFQELVSTGLHATDSRQREQIYFELQELYHEQALAITLSQQTGTYYEQRWVQGWYYNPMTSGYFYAVDLVE